MSASPYVLTFPSKLIFLRIIYKNETYVDLLFSRQPVPSFISDVVVSHIQIYAHHSVPLYQPHSMAMHKYELLYIDVQKGMYSGGTVDFTAGTGTWKHHADNKTLYGVNCLYAW
jgi:hypothetical protein